MWQNHVACTIQSFVTTSSSMASFMWTMAIAVFLYISISQAPSLTRFRTRWLLFLFHAISWGLPLWLCTLAVTFHVLGGDTFSASVGWCWIGSARSIPWPSSLAPEWRVFFWQMVAGKGIEICSYIFTPFLYIASKRALHTANERVVVYNTQLREALIEADRKLILVPVVFLFGRFWGTFRLILDFAFPQLGVSTWFWLAILQGFGDSAQGWANCLLFCFFTKIIRTKIIRTLCCSLDKSDSRAMEVIQ